MTKAGIIIIWC